MILAYVLQRPMALFGVIFVFVGSLCLILALAFSDRGSALWLGGILFAGLLLFVLAKRHPSAELVHHYYQALEKQEYEMAFQYLSQAMGMTRARFVQNEQSADAAQGTVTSHRITNVAINSSFRVGHASFTVKVKRNEQWHRVYPYVVKEGKQWKIGRFDSAQAIVNDD